MSVLRRYRIGDSPKRGMKVVELLGGGMGIVYVLELDRQDGTSGGSGVKLALKTCPTPSAMTAEGMALFQREATTWLMLLPHPNVVKAMSFEIDGGLPAILMEYLPGGNLRDRLRGEGLPLADGLAIAAGICEAMVFVAQAGLVHRDLKPENLLFTGDGSVKVTDFGISTLSAAGEGEDSGICGTLPYMAPEQLEGRRDVDIRADIFAFGIILHEMLSGRRPFEASTPSAMSECHRRARPELPAAVPREVRDLVARCLERRRGNRFRDFDELGEALAAASRAAKLADRLPGRVTREDLEARLDSTDWSNRGYAFRQLGDFDEALRCYRRSIDAASLEGPNDNFMMTPGVDKRRSSASAGLAATYDNMGMLLIAMQRLAEARDCFDRALELVADDGPAFFGLGQIALAEGRHDDALALYRKSVECEPGHGDLLLKYVRLCAALGREDEFEAGLATVIEGARTDVPFLVATGCFLGEEIGGRAASRFFDAALEADPDHAAAWYNRGVCLHREGRTENASAAYGEALAIDPDHPFAHFYAGIAALEAGRAGAAMEHLESIVGRSDLGPLGDLAGMALNGLRIGVPAEILAQGFATPGMIKYVP